MRNYHNITPTGFCVFVYLICYNNTTPTGFEPIFHFSLFTVSFSLLFYSHNIYLIRPPKPAPQPISYHKKTFSHTTLLTVWQYPKVYCHNYSIRQHQTPFLPLCGNRLSLLCTLQNVLWHIGKEMYNTISYKERCHNNSYKLRKLFFIFSRHKNRK
jgi:hypothetical protein